MFAKENYVAIDRTRNICCSAVAMNQERRLAAWTWTRQTLHSMGLNRMDAGWMAIRQFVNSSIQEMRVELGVW